MSESANKQIQLKSNYWTKKGNSKGHGWNLVEGLQEKKLKLELHVGQDRANQFVNDGCPFGRLPGRHSSMDRK